MAECTHELDSWLSNRERQCIEEVERAPDLGGQIQNERDASEKLWLLFQDCATCVAQLYKDRQHAGSLWVPFQNAASSVTNLYKECLEIQQRTSDLGFQSGYQQRNKDVLAWAKKRKRHIRREDLLAFLSGKSPPHQYQLGWGGSPRLSLEPGSPRGVVAAAAPSSQPITPGAGERSAGVGQGGPDDADLETFREAISSALGPSRNNGGASPSGFRSAAGLSSFIAEEFARHVESRKRPAPGSSSPGDVVMDSPTPKRPRLI